MNRIKRFLKLRPAPNRMTVGTFLLCVLPMISGITVTMLTKAGAFTLFGSSIGLMAYVITKAVVEDRYARNRARGITIEN